MEKHISGGIPYLINSKTGTYIPLCTYVDDHGNKCEAVLRKVVTIGKKIYQRCPDHLPKRKTKKYCEHFGCVTGSGRYRYCYDHDPDRQMARLQRRDERRYPSWLKGIDDLEKDFVNETDQDD